MSFKQEMLERSIEKEYNYMYSVDHDDNIHSVLYRGGSLMELQEKAMDLIARQLDVDRNQVTLEASFSDDLGADSLDTVELIMAFEEEFDIEIPDSDAEQIKTVKDAIDYLTKVVDK